MQLLATAGPAVAARSSNSFTSTCRGQATSAIDQYCEVIPSSTGGSGTGPRTPELAKTLPLRTAFALWRNLATRRLLFLPAAAHVRRSPGPSSGPLASPAGSGSVSTSGLWLPFALVLAAVASLLVAADQGRRLRRRRHPAT